MIYVTLFVLILIGILLWYIYKNILIPKEAIEKINQILSKEPPNYLLGEQKIIKHNGRNISYELSMSETNTIGTIVLINGWTQSLLCFPLHFCKPLLANGYNIIRVDNRGVGFSSWNDDWSRENAYLLKDMAKDILQILKVEKIDKVHLIGFSMGGMIGQRLAISFPEKIISLTSMMSSGYYHDPELPNVPKKFYFDFVIGKLIYGFKPKKLKDKIKSHLVISLLLNGSAEKLSAENVIGRNYFEYTKRRGSNPNNKQQSYAIKKSGSRYEELKKLEVPTLVIHGTEDCLIDFSHAKKYAPMIPNVRTLFLNGIGHEIPEKTAPKMIKTILDFYKGVGKVNA